MLYLRRKLKKRRLRLRLPVPHQPQTPLPKPQLSKIPRKLVRITQSLKLMISRITPILTRKSKINPPVIFLTTFLI
jgi:hypothetical protein